MDIIHNDPIWQKKKHILKKKKHKAYNFKKVKKKTTLEELNPTNYLLSAHNLIHLKRLRCLTF